MKLLGEEFTDRSYNLNEAASMISYTLKPLTPDEAEIVLQFLLSRVRAEQMKQHSSYNLAAPDLQQMIDMHTRPLHAEIEKLKSKTKKTERVEPDGCHQM